MDGWMYQRTLPVQRAFREFLEALGGDYQVIRGRVRDISRSFHDTFDWRLFRAGLVLEFDEGEGGALAGLRPWGASGGMVEENLDGIRRFPGLLPDRRLRGALSPLAEERALLDLGAVRLRTLTCEIRDTDGKILAFVDREQLPKRDGPGRGPTAATWARVRGLKGYRAEAERIAARLDAVAGPARGRSPADWCMAKIGACPGGYSTRLDVPLARDLPATAAMGRVLLFLLDLAERNVPGVREDIDTEFLHDFRIACRRSRSLVTQVRGVFDAQALAPFRETFSWLSGETGGQRDLDVFLLGLPGYEEMLPARDRGCLEPLRRLLQEQRDAAHARVLDALGSQRFRDFLRDWRAFLESAAVVEPAACGEDAATAAARAIRRMHRRMLKEGTASGAGDYSETLHELRKTGKKLRYLLEAFRSLYPDKDIEIAIALLRKLQNVLGDIVDYHVQQAFLAGWRTLLAERAETPAATVAALDRISRNCAELQVRAEHRFRDRFDRFAGKGNTKRMARLVGEH